MLTIGCYVTHSSGSRCGDVRVRDDSTGTGTGDVHLLTGVKIDHSGVAGGDDVVPSVDVHGLRLTEVTVHSYLTTCKY